MKKNKIQKTWPSVNRSTHERFPLRNKICPGSSCSAGCRSPGFGRSAAGRSGSASAETSTAAPELELKRMEPPPQWAKSFCTDRGISVGFSKILRKRKIYSRSATEFHRKENRPNTSQASNAQPTDHKSIAHHSGSEWRKEKAAGVRFDEHRLCHPPVDASNTSKTPSHNRQSRSNLELFERIWRIVVMKLETRKSKSKTFTMDTAKSKRQALYSLRKLKSKLKKRSSIFLAQMKKSKIWLCTRINGWSSDYFPV